MFMCVFLCICLCMCICWYGSASFYLRVNVLAPCPFPSIPLFLSSCEDKFCLFVSVWVSACLWGLFLCVCVCLCMYMFVSLSVCVFAEYVNVYVSWWRIYFCSFLCVDCKFGVWGMGVRPYICLSMSLPCARPFLFWNNIYNLPITAADNKYLSYILKKTRTLLP